jgi:dTDP-4-dehydrorhamnose 3,5-epimerase
MKVTRCPIIPGVQVLRAEPREDRRGMFADLWDQAQLPGHGAGIWPWRLSITVSDQWVLRGLHYQLDAEPSLGDAGEDVRDRMAKVVTCLRGEVLDVLVDLRLRSPAFGRHARFELVAPVVGQQAPVSLYVPPGVAHGYLVRSTRATMLYGFSMPHRPSLDRSLRWNDPALGIDWGLPHGVLAVLSDKDASGITLEQYLSGTEVFDTEA